MNDSKEQYRRLLRFGMMLLLLYIFVQLFYPVWRWTYSPSMKEQYYRRGHYLIISLYILAMYGMISVYGGWKTGYLRMFNLLFSHVLSILIVNAFTYVGLVLLTLRMLSPWPLILVVIEEWLFSGLWCYISTKTYQYIYPARKVLMVYGDYPEQALYQKIQNRGDRFIIGEKISIHKGIPEVISRIPDYQGVVICDIPAKERNTILKYCYAKDIRTYLTPKISDLILRGAENQHMFDTPILMARNSGLTFEKRLIKRTMDILFSLLMIIFFLPWMVIVALFIKLEDHGPVIYRQKRLTKGGRCFEVLKFRSMRMDAERDGVARLASEGDDRITRVGAVIRRYRLDELPQLFNILKGDMSLVGPRPERPEIAGEYEKEIQEFSFRLKVKAGLTGYAQVYGKYNTTAYDKLKLDLMYINDCNAALDLEIMLKTVQILFQREATEGISEDQTNAL